MQRLLLGLLPALLATTLVACNCTSERSSTSGAGTTSGAGATTGAPPPIGTLWVGGAGSLSPSTLADSSGLTKFDETCNPPGSATPIDGASAFDAQGDLWVSFPSGPTSGQLIEWKSSDLATCATAQPVVVGSMGFPLAAMAFDATGGLWGTFLHSSGEEEEASGIVFFEATDLAAGNLSNAQQFLSIGCGPVSALCDPSGLAFDSAGYLWVGSIYSVLAYSPKTLTARSDAGTLVPDHVLTTPQAAALDAGYGDLFFGHYVYLDPTFDAAGNLWVGADDSEGDTIDHQIVEYSKAQLENIDAQPTPTPALVIHESAAQLAQLLISWGALAFDSQGNLWAGATQTKPNLWRYPAASLTTPSPEADVSITLPGDPSISLAFAPAPSGLPLH